MKPIKCGYCRKEFTPKRARTRFCCHICGIKGASQPGKKDLPIEDIIQAYNDGGSSYLIGKHHGVSQTLILRILKRNNVPKRSKYDHFITNNPHKGKRLTQEDKDRISQYTIKQFSDPKARERASKTQIKVMAEGRIAKVSKLEDRVAEELDKLGIEFKRQLGINDPIKGGFCACVDFLLSDGRILEVNGTYWHTDPRAYPDGPIYASQKRTLKRYEKKARLLRSFGKTVLELWEDDFVKSPRQALLDILSPVK